MESLLCLEKKLDMGNASNGFHNYGQQRHPESLCLSVMKLSVHVDLSLCDEARQVWDWVGDICKEKHWRSIDGAQVSTHPGPCRFCSLTGVGDRWRQGRDSAYPAVVSFETVIGFLSGALGT